METLQNQDKQKKEQDKPKGAVYSVKVLLNQNHKSIDGRRVVMMPGSTSGNVK